MVELLWFLSIIYCSSFLFLNTILLLSCIFYTPFFFLFLYAYLELPSFKVVSIHV